MLGTEIGRGAVSTPLLDQGPIERHAS